MSDILPYTPGPWKATLDRDIRGRLGWRIDSASRALMAVCAWPTDEEAKSREAETTAKLMAAAPEMAELLSLAPCTCPEWETGMGMMSEHDDKHEPCFRNRAKGILKQIMIT